VFRLTGDEVVFVNLLVTAPLPVAAFSRPWVTVGVGLVATALAVALAPPGTGPTDRVRELAIVTGSLLAVGISVQRERTENDVAQLRAVADVAQNAVLWPLSPQLGDLTLRARYASASRLASIGGDLYEAVETEHGVRVILGDVRGKGLPAVRLASAVLGSFREVAHTRADLRGIRAALEHTVRRLAGPEDFVTAVLIEVSAAGAAVQSSGHPAPVIVLDGVPRELDVGPVALPLGLGQDDPPSTPFTLPPGGRLLLFTDGLVEARDGAGAFYPLLAQLDALCERDPDRALDELLRRLQEHCGGACDDDIAMLLIDRCRDGR